MAKVHAKIKLAKKTTKVAPKQAHPNSDLAAYGARWVAGESIRALAKEAGMDWPVLQARVKPLGYFRPPVRHKSS
jgi:hypothetical protein